MYPGYKPREALEEYAIIFFTLLEEGYRKKAAEYLWQARLARVALADSDTYAEYTRKLELAASDGSDILNSDGGDSTPTELKRVLGG